MSTAFPITGFAHIGLRVADFERSRAFYEALGFRLSAGPMGSEPVAILDHPSGIELNLIINAQPASVENVLMDVPQKHPGYTHVALAVSDVFEAEAQAKALGLTISGGPMQHPTGARAMFLRDPDRNVVELFEPARE